MVNCYGDADGIPALFGPPTWGVCGDATKEKPFVTCCAVGDVCLEGSLCQYQRQQTNGSGYYIGFCTGMSADSCTPVCGTSPNYVHTEVIFNYTGDAWRCCDFTDTGPDCTIPLLNPPANFNLTAPPPRSIRATASIIDPTQFVAIDAPVTHPAAVYTSYSVEPASSTTSSSPRTTVTAVSVIDKTPSGTWAGLAISVVIAVAALIGVTYRVLQVRKLKRMQQGRPTNVVKGDKDAGWSGSQELSPVPYSINSDGNGGSYLPVGSHEAPQYDAQYATQLPLRPEHHFGELSAHWEAAELHS